MNPVEQIREYVREIALKVKREQKSALREELKLRKYIRKLIRETEEEAPHESTGINVLEDLLKTIVPIIGTNFKLLTSGKEQRDSFREHIVTAVQNLLATESVYFTADSNRKNKAGAAMPQSTAGGDEALAEQEGEEEVPTDPAFIDIDKDKKDKEAKDNEPKPEDAFVELEDEDTTGRGFALRTFNKIQKQQSSSSSK